ncbi:RNA polymerase sigma factor [Microlunatus ginsengisoli]|uniref:RNA polymerase sigma factor n=1 Tax=Microlunatus ginsengisoli TaxID=363863 RepID=UPI0031E11394
MAEATLVARAQDGDLDSFEVLVRRYQAPIFRLAYRLLSDRDEAEDATQDTMVQVWRRLPTLAEPAAFRGWLYRIATRHCTTLLRTRARRRTRPAEDPTLELGEALVGGLAGDDPADAAERAGEVEALAAALAELPEEQRVCWVLRELHGLSYAEIGYAAHLPQSTVRGRIARARQSLLRGMASWR